MTNWSGRVFDTHLHKMIGREAKGSHLVTLCFPRGAKIAAWFLVGLLFTGMYLKVCPTRESLRIYDGEAWRGDASPLQIQAHCALFSQVSEAKPRSADQSRSFHGSLGPTHSDISAGICGADKGPDSLHVTIILSNFGERLDERDRGNERDKSRVFVRALDAMSPGGRILISAPESKEAFRRSMMRRIVGELQEGAARQFHVRLMYKASLSEPVSSQELFTHAVRELHMALEEVVGCLIHKGYSVRSLAVVGGQGAVLFGKAIEKDRPVFDHVLIVDSLDTAGKTGETLLCIGESKTTILVGHAETPSIFARLFSSLFGSGRKASNLLMTSPSACLKLKAVLPGTSVRMIRAASPTDPGCRYSEGRGEQSDKSNPDGGTDPDDTGCWEVKDATKTGTDYLWSTSVRKQSTQQLIAFAFGAISSTKKLSQSKSACHMIQDFFCAASQVRELERIGFYGQEFSNELKAANCPDGCFRDDYQAIVMRSIIGWVDEIIDYCACPRGSRCRKDCERRCLDYVKSLKTVCPNFRPPPIDCPRERQSAK